MRPPQILTEVAVRSCKERIQIKSHRPRKMHPVYLSLRGHKNQKPAQGHRHIYTNGAHLSPQNYKQLLVPNPTTGQGWPSCTPSGVTESLGDSVYPPRLYPTSPHHKKAFLGWLSAPPQTTGLLGGRPCCHPPQESHPHPGSLGHRMAPFSKHSPQKLPLPHP